MVIVFRRLHRSRSFILGALGRAQKVLRHVALRVTPTIVDYDSTNFLKHCFVVSCLFVRKRASHLAIASSTEVSICLCGDSFPCQGWVCQWKPFWIQVEDSFKKAFVEEWVFISDEPSEGPSTIEVPMLHNTDHSEYIPVTPSTSKHSTSLPWETAKPQDKACFWERIEAPLPPLRPRPKCNFIQPRQLSPFPERLRLSFSHDEILSSYEEFDTSGTDLFTPWVKMSEHEILVQHVVDIEKATAVFREAS